jgi:signal transduction histidine kinase
MRFLPKSLGGQLALTLVAALVVAHLVSLLALSEERDRAVEAAVRFGLIERIAAVVDVIDAANPDIAERLAATLSSRFVHLSIDSEPALPDRRMREGESEFAAALATELGLSATPRVRLDERGPPRRDWGDRRSRDDDGPGPRWRHDDDRPPRRGPRRRDLNEIALSLPLGEGQWLNAEALIRRPDVGPAWPWLVSLGASAVLTLLAAAVAVRRITGPMRALAAAAQRIGRGEATGPIPPRGPAEVRTTVEAFNTMQERLSRFVRDRTLMVAAISHDLRTPITSLRLRAEFIADEDLKADVIRTLDEMQAMTDATLAFAREEGMAEATRAVDLAALLDGLAEDHAAMGHAVRYEGPEHLVWRGRPVSLKRAVANLVENAVRYGGSATVGLSAGEEVTITVADEGPGIPADRLEDVFEPFVRLETSRSRETGGVGLGLAIARSVVRAHGGELRLVNRPGGGLLATITLP